MERGEPDLAEHVILHQLGHVLGLSDIAGAAADSILWTKPGALASHHSPAVSCGDIGSLQGL